MEDSSFYNITIVSLIIGIVIVVASLAMARAESERFTELYFTNYQELDKYSNGKSEFSFTLHNAEGEDKEYNYMIKVNGDEVKEGKIFVEDGGFTNVKEFVILDVPFDEDKIEVSLPEKDQEIHFFVKYLQNDWVVYDNGKESALSCLPITRIKKGDPLVIMLKGSYAQGWPIMQVLVNGVKKYEFEVKGNNEEYVLIDSVEEDMIVDLVFNNDYTVNERGIRIADRNIKVDHIRTFGKFIDYVYDRGKPDCDDLSEGDMWWNGALRFEVRI